jgi:uncharacterized protein YraI
MMKRRLSIGFVFAIGLLCMLTLYTTPRLFAAPTLQADTPPFQQATVLRNANLRAGPGTTFAIAGSARQGQQVEIVACNPGCSWYQLKSGAWIAAFLVTGTPAAADTNTSPTPTAVATGTITSTVTATANRNGNLRGGPGTNYPVVGSVTAGQSLKLTGQNATGDWLQLEGGAWIARILVNGAPTNLTVVTTTTPAARCDSSYPDVCIAPAPPDLDCSEVPYTNFRVQGADPHGFDADKDGIGCEPDNRSSAAPAPEPVVQTQAPPPATSDNNCHPSYPGVCIPPAPPDLDCGDIPYRRFQVVGADPHRFDGDRDGVGCES